MNRLSIFLPVLLALLLCACARQPAQSPITAPPAEDMAAWAQMQAISAQAEPFRLQLSMRFGEEGNTRRVTALLWGNGDAAWRLDVMAGVGASIAKVSETGEDFLVYAPRENRAYAHDGPTRPLLKIGVPLPIGLASLGDLLTGRFTEVFGKEPAGAGGAPGFYRLEGPLAGELQIAANGNPIAWKQQKGGWSLAIAYDEAAPHLPKSLRLANASGKMAVILVKERERPQKPFTAEQMRLDLPAGAPVLPISQFKTS